MMEFNNQEVIETTSTTTSSSPQSNQREYKSLATVDGIQDWLITYLSQLLEIDPNKISLTTSFDRYGLDSSATIGLTSDLGDWLGRSIDPGITYDYPTIETLAEYLAE
jgi:acyl carrier protein